MPVDCGACTCTAHDQCGADALCVDGNCHDCDVVVGQSLADAVSAAPGGATLYVCPGTYDGGLEIKRPLSIIGAGQGPDGAIIGGEDGLVDILVLVRAGSEAQPVVLRGLRIQDGGIGVVVNSPSTVTMVDCTVRGNVNAGITPGAGVLVQSGSTAHLTGCTIEENRSTERWGGGVCNNGGQVTLTNCLIRKNSALTGGGIMNLGGVLTLRQTRVTDNEASVDGSGVTNDGGTVSLEAGNTICANDPWETLGKNFDGGDACTETCPGA